MRCVYSSVRLVVSDIFFFFQAEDGIRDFCLSRGLGDVYKRQGLKRDGGNVLVVTHSFVVRTLVYLIDPERVNDPVKIPNASVTRISYDGSDFRLGEIGSTAWQRP